MVRQEPEAEKHRNEDETNKAKIKAKNSLEDYCFTAKNTHTEEKLNNKFARRQGRDAGHLEQVQGVKYVDKEMWSGTQISSR